MKKTGLSCLLFFAILIAVAQTKNIEEQDLEEIEDLLFSYKTSAALDKIDCFLLSDGLEPEVRSQLEVNKVEALVKSNIYDRALILANNILIKKNLCIEHETKVLLMRALLFEITADYGKSRKDLERVKEIFVSGKLKKDELYGVFLYRQASWYRQNDQPDPAKSHAWEAYNFGKKYDHKRTVATAAIILGFLSEDTSRKTGFFREALHLYRDYGDLNGIAAVHNALSKVGMLENDLQKARSYNDSLFQVIHSNDTSYFLSSAYKVKSEILEQQEKLDSALFYFKKFRNREEKELLHQQQLYVKELQFQYDLNDKKLKNNLLRKDLENEKRQNNFLILGGAGLAGTLILTSGLLFVLYRKNSKIKYQAQEITNTNSALADSVNEKELLLKEIYHRVKNNLALILSLVEFQIDDSKDSLVKDKFRSLENRIKAVAMAHSQFMPGSERRDSERYNLEKYIDNIIASYSGVPHENIEFHTDVEEVLVILDTAIPVGILVNELISNSVKHARVLSGPVRIEIKVYMQEKHIFIKYSDNGEVFQIKKNADSLGLFIIESMVQQLNGELKREGATYNIHFEI